MPMFGLRYATWENAHSTPPLPYDQWEIQEGYTYDNFNEAKKQAKYRESASLSYFARQEYFDSELQMYMYKLRDGYENSKPECKYVAYKIPAEQDYRTREAAKIEAGDYILLPEKMKGYEYSYPRLTADGKMISYYESERDAMMDRLKEVKSTRYFSFFYDHETMWDYMAELGLISNCLTLAFATTREDIRFIYENGPESCMSGSAGNYGCDSIHPTEAYASSDLELAYIYHGDDFGEGDAIVGRALCNAKTKQWVRIYGDIHRMKKLLEEKGYTSNQYALGGCRLLKIFAQNDTSRLILPYLDGACNEVEFLPDQEFMKVITRPIILRGTTDGYVNL